MSFIDEKATPYQEADRLYKDLASGRTDTAGQLFARQGASAPVIVWAPSDRDFRHPSIRAFVRTLEPAMDDIGRVFLSAFDSDQLSGLSDWAMLLTPQPDGRNFRYLYYGSGIADHYGQDMTGKTTNDFPGHIGTFFTALYRAVCDRRQWVLSEHEPPSAIFVQAWRRLIVPLLDPRGDVAQIVALNVPENPLRAGLDAMPDPILVVGPDNRIRFANQGARQTFAQLTTTASLSGEYAIEHLFGPNLRASDPEAHLPHGRQIEEDVTYLLSDTMRLDFTLTMRATLYRDDTYYIAALHPKHRLR